MAERPILLFGQSNKAEKSRLFGLGPKIHYPSHSRQSERLTPKMNALQTAVAHLEKSPRGIEAERTLVFDVIGSTDSFYTAVKNLGSDADWMFEMPETFETSDDFFLEKEDKKTKERKRNEEKNVIAGKVYCVLSNTRAMKEMLSLWTQYSQDPRTSFPRGKTGLRDVFNQLQDIRFWGYRERVEETGILDIWREELQDKSLKEVRCEFELFFRSDPQKRNRNERQLRDEIKAHGGTVITSTVISDIAYHAVLASVPRNLAEEIINDNRDVSIVTAESIMFFRPVGQAVVISDDNSLASLDENFQVPRNEEVFDEPVIALFDGLPQQNHPYLQDRLTVDDPENYADAYVVKARKHGTSMASMITLGDLSNITHTATHKIYVRPIMRPFEAFNGYGEETPPDSLLVDKIHVAVRRLFEEEAGRSAPTVKVINLSIGIPHRQFDRLMSPLARLIDWLSWKYKVLFIVSAGNHLERMNTEMPFTDFKNANPNLRDKAIISHVNNESRNLKLLSPAESVSALTVGATFEDASSFTENARQILPNSDGLPAAFSSLGMGMNNAVKPDILFPGGRMCVKEDIEKDGSCSAIITWNNTSVRKPGTASAAPSGVRDSRIMYTRGTSNSAALISHEASRCYDTLLEVFESAGENVPEDHLALLIKAMLVHGAEWDILSDKYAEVLNLKTQQDCSQYLHRFLGFGKPNIERAIECAKNRVTLISYGNLKNGEASVYNLPLPFDFSSSKIRRRLTATLTYFPPIRSENQKYRAAQLWYEIENKERVFLKSPRVNVQWQAVRRGTVQHEIFENNDIVVWGEDDPLQIKINCRGDADEKFTENVPYALMVSFEIKDSINIDVYAKIADRISPKVPI